MRSIFLFILIICMKQLCAQSSWFSAPANYVVNSGPTYVISNDFNLDGFNDLVSANYNSNQISILLGNGGGIFGAPTNFSVGTNPQAVISADFNGDGYQDLATANNNSNNISVLMGLGTGIFGAATNFATGSMPIALVSSDFNGDGNMDLAVANSNTSFISVLLGTGTGSFNGAINYSTALAPRSITSADFNGDGTPDLAVVNGSANNVSVLLGTGSGTFGQASNFSAGGQPYSVTCADFNGDTKVDMAVANQGSGDVTIRLGTGTGGFGPVTNFPVGTWPNSQSSWPYLVINADFNGDAIVDLATANWNSNDVSVLLGTGTGSFNSPLSFSANSHPYSLTSADFNGDAKPDLAVANLNSSDVSVLLNVPPPACLATVADYIYNISPLNWGVQVQYSPQITSATWFWGDGTTSNGLYPSHTYAVAGAYNICVTAYASCGDTASVCQLDSIYRIADRNSMININVFSYANSVDHTSDILDPLKVYPNPFNDQLKLNFTSNKDQTLTYTLYDLMDHEVLKDQVSLYKGENEIKLNTMLLNRGIYFLGLIREGKIARIIKVVK